MEPLHCDCSFTFGTFADNMSLLTIILNAGFLLVTRDHHHYPPLSLHSWIFTPWK